MNIEKAEEARSRMKHGADEMFRALTDYMTVIFQDFAEHLSSIDWSAMAKLKEMDPDKYNWNASGPIRRVQLRRARAMMKER